MQAILPLLLILSGAPPAADSAVAAPPEGAKPLAAGALVEQATVEMKRIRRTVGEVLRRVEDARREKDLVKLLCADEKFARLKALVAVAEQAHTTLAEAVANRDDGAATELSKISIARRKADGLREEATACIGQLAYEVGGKSIVVEEPADLPARRARVDEGAPPTLQLGKRWNDYARPLARTH
jgi:hypothetical protein